ncbi:L,D-transpeptidase [candidate division WWE3 bacterium]|jgi:lipoprotein-anchoring transpeptidase ErfK/SrfK|nr:L,D-transpeptidase [candidate division WWE3 bacterium]MBT7349275.1 L,D-transpeptidase [candidate division WWE3 bacterium]
MQKKLLILITATVALATAILLTDPANLKAVTVFKSGTQVGNINLSRTAWDLGYASLTSRLTTPFYINLESKSRGVTPEELGITLDRDKLAKMSSTCRTKLFRLFCKNTSNENIDPNNVFILDQEKIDLFWEDLNKEVSFLAENNIVSFEDNTFRALSPEATVSLNRETFDTPEGIASIITTDNFVVDLEIVSEDNKELQKTTTESLIAEISAPLLIKYGRNAIYISSENVASFITSIEKDDFFFGQINKEPIARYMEDLAEEFASEDIKVVKDLAVESIVRAMLFRAANYEINNAVILPLEGNPKSDGSLHDEYLEIIKSQQRLYKFKNGELIKTYIVSTGLTWETPPGQYEVLGKQKMTISYYDDWYMPNYLPIGTINGYFFGFHEIPYHMDAAGNIYSRDANTMGSPATGGCIQLAPGDSLEVFDNTPVGTPVYIHE